MIVVLMGLLGLLLGSFINALVWRLKTKRDWVHERSICPHCKRTLGAQDLIPVVSWLLLKGKCRQCKKPISPQYPLVEILTAVLFALSYAFWPEPFSAAVYIRLACWLIFLTILIALAVYDFKYMILPNKLVLAGAAPVAIATVVGVLISGEPLRYVLGVILGILAFGGVFWLLYQFSDGRWIGGGDVKLGFVLGAWLASPALSFFAIVTASWLGLIVAGVLYLWKRNVSLSSRLPFGPMLIAGTIIATLWGHRLLNAYLSLMTV